MYDLRRIEFVMTEPFQFSSWDEVVDYTTELADELDRLGQKDLANEARAMLARCSWTLPLPPYTLSFVGHYILPACRNLLKG